MSSLGRLRRGGVRPSPLFLGFVALAGLGVALSWGRDAAGSRAGDLGVFVLVLASWVVTLCLHEFGHAYVAYRAGDRSVEAAGYLTLNPLRYAHPVLSIAIPLLFIVQGGIGLPGGAVYLHRHDFRSRGMQSLAAAAGPLVNLAFAVGTLTLVHAHLADARNVRVWAALGFLGFVQLTAAVLNLLPIPGLDGYAIVEPYLDPATVRAAEQVKPWGMLGLIVLLQIPVLNARFFDLVYRLYDISGVPRAAAVLGRAFFQFWVRNPA